MSTAQLSRVEPRMPTTTSRRMIDHLRQQLAKASGRPAKTLRRQIRRLAASSAEVFRAEQPNALRERQRANIRRREARDDFILRKRNPVAWKERQERRAKASGVVKPVFE